MMNSRGVLLSLFLFFGPAALLGAGPLAGAIAVPEPLRFSAVLFPKRTQISFWAYRKDKELYFPASTLAKILKVRAHRYDRSSAVILRLGHQKAISLKAGQAALTLGGKTLSLNSPILDTPQKDDLLIPLSVTEQKEFQRYTEVYITQADSLKLAVYPVQTLDAPVVETQDESYRVVFYLPRSLRDYEITYMPAEETKKTKPELLVKFPYAELGKKAAIGAPLHYTAQYDEKERSLIFAFALPEATAIHEINAKEETLGSHRLILSIPNQEETVEPLPIASSPPRRRGSRPVLKPNLDSGFRRNDTKVKKTPPPVKAQPKLAKVPVPAPPKLAKAIPSMPTVSGRVSTRPLPLSARPSGNKAVKKVILIDAGHGGKDSGAMLRSGAMEKTINLAIALKVAQKLKEKAPDYKVMLTRKGDVYVDLSSRAYLTVKQGPLALVSIHSNASRAKNKGGYEIYVPADISMDPQAVELVKRENGGKALSAAQAEASLLHRSEKLAMSISGQLSRNVGRNMNNRGIRKGDFYILRETRAPAVLIESGFLTHKSDARLLQNPRFQDKFADGISDGILRYLKNAN